MTQIPKKVGEVMQRGFNGIIDTLNATLRLVPEEHKPVVAGCIASAMVGAVLHASPSMDCTARMIEDAIERALEAHEPPPPPVELFEPVGAAVEAIIVH